MPMVYMYVGTNKYARTGPLINMILDLLRKNKIEIDVSKYLNLKRKAVFEFRSETSIISKKQEKPLDGNLNRYLKKRKILCILL